VEGSFEYGSRHSGSVAYRDFLTSGVTVNF
jgi:hypothetical protein